jgi:hypothetical protein
MRRDRFRTTTTLFPIAQEGLIYKVANRADFWNNDSKRNGGKGKYRDRAGD